MAIKRFGDRCVREGHSAPDVAAAVQRIINSRDAATAPTFSVLAQKVREARQERVRDEIRVEAESGRRWVPDEGYRAGMAAYHRLVREFGVYWCRSKGAFVQPENPAAGCGHDPSLEPDRLWRPGEAEAELARAEVEEWRRRPRPQPAPGGFSSYGGIAEGQGFRDAILATRKKAAT